MDADKSPSDKQAEETAVPVAESLIQEKAADSMHGSAEVIESPPARTAAPSGKRLAFRDIRRQLQESELANPGVHKLLLEDLERAEAECDILQGYVDRFHQADKAAAVLEERLRTQTALEIMFGVGLTVGGAIIGLAPLFWADGAKGPAALIVGFLLMVGSILGRFFKR